jgi:transposase
LKEPGDLGESELEFVDALYRLRPEVNQAALLARAFAGMMRERRGEELDLWIEQARQPDVPRELGIFATGLKSDYDAVKAALTTEWSNGQVEGQVNRLKLLKRQMYGRAKFDLLRQRVLHAR